MKTTLAGKKLIQRFEQCVLRPYRDVAGVATIGWGNTFYPGGKKVTMQDRPIYQAEADKYFDDVLLGFEQGVASLVKVPLKPYQFDALVSLAYNIGLGAFGKSTLLKIVNVNPDDPRIPAEFARWNKSKGKVYPGLTKRRALEAVYYTTGKLSFNNKT
jgi:lysozyme